MGNEVLRDRREKVFSQRSAPIGLAYFETFVRFANPTSMKASGFFVSLGPLSKSH